MNIFVILMPIQYSIVWSNHSWFNYTLLVARYFISIWLFINIKSVVIIVFLHIEWFIFFLLLNNIH